MTLEQTIEYVKSYKFSGKSTEALYIPVDSIPADKVLALLDGLAEFQTKVIANHHGFKSVIEVKNNAAL